MKKHIPSVKEIKEQVAIYFEKAKTLDQLQANDAIRKARLLAMTKRMRLTKEQRMQYCHNCYAYLTQSQTKTRITNSFKIMVCPFCQHQNKYGFQKP